MSVRGLRVHIAGSAASGADRATLEAAHEFVRDLAERLIATGAGLVLGVGAEPLGDAGLPCTFDWSILESIAGTTEPGPNWPPNQPGRFWVVASQRALARIPDSRQSVWADCMDRVDFEIELSERGWRMGGVIRAAQVLRGDVLIVLGGGAGVEQLAHLYRDEGKPVIPISCDLGAFSRDGNGGGTYLHGHALSAPSAFFELKERARSAAGRLSSLQIRHLTEAVSVAEATLSLLTDLKPPRAFYVRLLDHQAEEFGVVEAFFRDAVYPVVSANGSTPHEVGRAPLWRPS